MEYKDYYKTLGVSKSASAKELKAAYRRLARKHHPDMNAGNSQAEARFKEINEAYEVLSDPEKRRRYDELGANWSAFESGAAGPGGGGMPWGGGRVRVKVGGFDQDLGGFSEFFRTFFGAGVGGEAWPGSGSDEVGDGGLRDLFGRPRAAHSDVEREIAITLEEALKGGTRTLKSAGGRTVEVKIPAGLRSGARIRIPGEGGGSGGRGGDLYLRVALEPHRQFSVQGDDLLTTVTVPISTAVLGGEVEVPSLDGRVSLKVPAGTPAGRVFRVKGQGLPRQGERGVRGDLMVSLALAVPSDPPRRIRELFEELRRLGS